MANIKCKYTKLVCSVCYSESECGAHCFANYCSPQCGVYAPIAREKRGNTFYINDCCKHLQTKPCMFEKNAKTYLLDENKLQIGKKVYYLKNEFNDFQDKWYVDSAIYYLEIDGEVLVNEKR